MGRVIRNGIDYSGLINANGVFIDTGRVIKANTTFRSSMSYTATEDCVLVSYTLSNGDITINVDNKWVGGAYGSSTTGFPITLFLKKGQTVSITGVNASYDSSYTIYGVLQGSNILPDYSTTEHKTGRKWIDGKDIYERTVDLGQNVDISYTSWTEINADSTDVDLIVDVKGLNAGGTNYDIMLGKKVANHKFEAQTSRNNYTASLRYLTMQYTKTS